MIYFFTNNFFFSVHFVLLVVTNLLFVESATLNITNNDWTVLKLFFSTAGIYKKDVLLFVSIVFLTRDFFLSLFFFVI